MINKPIKNVTVAIIAVLLIIIAFLFLFGKLFPYSPIISGFAKHELNRVIIYIQKGAQYDDYSKFDTLIPTVEKFHELQFVRKPELFIFQDSIKYIHHSPSKARFCAFSSGRLFISPWALREAQEGKIS
jgi:hypothetical protein